MSAAVGSIPSFTRSGRPSPNLRSRPPSGSASTTFRSRNEASFDPLSVMAAMLESRARRTGPRAPPDIPDHAAVGVAPRPRRALSRYAGIRSDTAEAAAYSQAAARTPGTELERRRPDRGRAQEAEGQEAPPCARPPRTERARADLDGVRDDDGGRERAAAARGEGAAALGRELDAVRLDRGTDREADRQREPDRQQRRRDLAQHQERGHRDRGQAPLRAPGRRPARH